MSNEIRSDPTQTRSPSPVEAASRRAGAASSRSPRPGAGSPPAPRRRAPVPPRRRRRPLPSPAREEHIRARTDPSSPIATCLSPKKLRRDDARRTATRTTGRRRRPRTPARRRSRPLPRPRRRTRALGRRARPVSPASPEQAGRPARAAAAAAAAARGRGGRGGEGQDRRASRAQPGQQQAPRGEGAAPPPLPEQPRVSQPPRRSARSGARRPQERPHGASGAASAARERGERGGTAGNAAAAASAAATEANATAAAAGKATDAPGPRPAGPTGPGPAGAPDERQERGGGRRDERRDERHQGHEHDQREPRRAPARQARGARQHSFEETRIAILEDGRLAELLWERKSSENIVGNIYKGVVENVLPGISSAFVNIGFEKNAYLYISDVLGEQRRRDRRDAEEGPGHHGPGRQGGHQHQGHEGHDGRLPAGPLPGVHAVPELRRHLQAHRRTPRSASAWTKIMDRLVAKILGGKGLVVRTEAEGAAEEELEREVKYLLAAGSTVQKKFETTPPPALLHKDLDLRCRWRATSSPMRSTSIMLDNKEVYKRSSTSSRASPELKERVRFYEWQDADLQGVQHRVARSTTCAQIKVPLPNGGSIIIQEAGVAVRHRRQHRALHRLKSQEETVTQTNMEAADEVAHQLRLRNIGGIIVVDFIDMRKPPTARRSWRPSPQAVPRRPRQDPHPADHAAGPHRDDARAQARVDRRACSPRSARSAAARAGCSRRRPCASRSSARSLTHRRAPRRLHPRPAAPDRGRGVPRPARDHREERPALDQDPDGPAADVGRLPDHPGIMRKTAFLTAARLLPVLISAARVRAAETVAVVVGG